MPSSADPSSPAPAAPPGAPAGGVERRAHPDEREAFRATHPAPLELTSRDGPVLRGSRLARLTLRLAGWRLVYDGMPSAQGVFIAYPHTSNWDFPIGMLAKWALGWPFAFWGKDTLFRVPLFGAWLRWLGGIPVDRSAPQGVVGQMAKRLAEARERGEFMWLALSPEGTRSRTEGWRSGFYQLAVLADVPLGVAYFDYARKEIGIDSYWRLSGDRAMDIAAIAARLKDKRGCRHEQASPIRFL